VPVGRVIARRRLRLHAPQTSIVTARHELVCIDRPAVEVAGLKCLLTLATVLPLADGVVAAAGSWLLVSPVNIGLHLGVGQRVRSLRLVHCSILISTEHSMIIILR